MLARVGDTYLGGKKLATQTRQYEDSLCAGVFSAGEKLIQTFSRLWIEGNSAASWPAST